MRPKTLPTSSPPIPRSPKKDRATIAPANVSFLRLQKAAPAEQTKIPAPPRIPTTDIYIIRGDVMLMPKKAARYGPIKKNAKPEVNA